MGEKTFIIILANHLFILDDGYPYTMCLNVCAHKAYLHVIYIYIYLHTDMQVSVHIAIFEEVLHLLMKLYAL